MNLAGDGRCDSPGFCAKYGTYTLMDLSTKLILDFHIAQSTETGNSGAMEKHGLKVCLDNLTENNIQVDTIVTDRHVQIRKFLKTEHPEINHQFDVWHMGKSVGKKIGKKAKAKGFEDLGRWRKSICHHLWYACDTCDGDENILLEKWISVLHHVTNHHIFPGQFVQECGHGEIVAQPGKKKKKWIKPDSPAYHALKDIITNNILIKDIKQLNKFFHTGDLKSYHALMLKYLPKRLHYGMDGMNARTKLAVLDHNHNTNREQATIKKGKRKGELRYKAECPKMTKEWVAKKIYKEKSYSHVHDMVKSAVESQTNNTVPPRQPTRNLPRNIAAAEKPQKAELIQRRLSRFRDK